jgi:hypothetical protein
MKKLYFLNEEESNRILNLHKNAVKRQYLSEQVSDDQELDEIDWGSVSTGAAAGAAGGALIGGVGAVPGAIIGGAASLLSQAFGGSYSVDAAKKILSACNSKGQVGPPQMNRQTLNTIADAINTAIEGMGTDEDAIKNNLSKLQTIPDLCGVARTYQTRHGESLFDAIDGDIDSPNEWKTYVFLPLLDAYENTKELAAKVKQQPNAGQGANKGGVAANAQKCGWGTDVEGYKNSGWKCPKPGTKVNTGTGGGGSTSLAPKVKAIQSKVGVTQTGTMDQATIDALMAKINGGGSAQTPQTAPTQQSNVAG